MIFYPGDSEKLIVTTGRLSQPAYATHLRLETHPDGNSGVSDQAQRRISREIRGWHLHRRSDRSLNDLAEHINPVVLGWHTYYGRYCPSAVAPTLARLNEYLVRWAQRTYARLRTYPRRAWQLLADWRHGSRGCSSTGRWVRA